MDRFVQLLVASGWPAIAWKYFGHLDRDVKPDVVILAKLNRYEYAEDFERSQTPGSSIHSSFYGNFSQTDRFLEAHPFFARCPDSEEQFNFTICLQCEHLEHSFSEEHRGSPSLDVHH